MTPVRMPVVARLPRTELATGLRRTPRRRLALPLEPRLHRHRRRIPNQSQLWDRTVYRACAGAIFPHLRRLVDRPVRRFRVWAMPCAGRDRLPTQCRQNGSRILGGFSKRRPGPRARRRAPGLRLRMSSTIFWQSRFRRMSRRTGRERVAVRPKTTNGLFGGRGLPRLMMAVRNPVLRA